MAAQNEDLSMALFCDFENIALGVRDAQYEKFDIKPILEKLLLKGSIVVKKAYCDWERYKAHKAAMHEANFELIEIPHLRQSGKNSADIRLVVDALDLCYTKAHLNTFVIISGDSDFSPLVSKLRENAKHVIGVGVKQSTSDLLIANCDEFIYYDDLVREREAKRSSRPKENQRRSPEEESKRREEMEKRRSQGIELAVATLEDLLRDRADDERVWASVLKEALKRRNPGFNESYFGFRAFGNLLEEAAARGLLEFGRDDKSGAYVRRRPLASADAGPESANGSAAESMTDEEPTEILPASAASDAEDGAPISSGADESQCGEDGVRQHAEPPARSAALAASEAAAIIVAAPPDDAWPHQPTPVDGTTMAPANASFHAKPEDGGEAAGTLLAQESTPTGEARDHAAPPTANEKPRRRRSRAKPATEAPAGIPADGMAQATNRSAPETLPEGPEAAAVSKPRRRPRKPKATSSNGEV